MRPSDRGRFGLSVRHFQADGLSLLTYAPLCRQEGGNLTATVQSNHRHVPTMRNSCRLEARTADLLKIPNEYEQLPIRLLRAALGKVRSRAFNQGPPDHPKKAKPSRAIKDDERVRAR